MDWRTLLMDVGITVAVIGLIGGVIKMILDNRNISEKVGTHADSSKAEHKEILDILIESKTNDRRDYESLSEKQQAVYESAKLIPYELMRLNDEVKELRNRIQGLQDENVLLRAENKQLATDKARLEAKKRHYVKSATVRKSRQNQELER